MKRLLLLVVFCIVWVFGLGKAYGQAVWQLVKVDGRDYLTAQNIAQFYALKPSVLPVANETVLEHGHTSLVFGNDSRSVEINGVRVYLSFPLLQRGGQTLVSRFDLAKTIEPALRPTMIGNLPPCTTFVLDAGHGGTDSGGGIGVASEKNFTLDVIRYLQTDLQARGLRFVDTRSSDVFVPLENRAALANQVPGAVLVSVHFNSSQPGDAASGIEVYAMSPQGAPSTSDAEISPEQAQHLPGNDFDNASLALAESVQASVLGHLPASDRGVKRARFEVLKFTHAPAILIEGGFLTNATDSRQIGSVAWRERFAGAIAEGLASYADLAGRRTPLKLLTDYRLEQLPFLGTIVNPVGAFTAPLALPAANPVIRFGTNSP